MKEHNISHAEIIRMAEATKGENPGADTQTLCQTFVSRLVGYIGWPEAEHGDRVALALGLPHLTTANIERAVGQALATAEE